MSLYFQIIRQNFNQCLFVGFVIWAIFVSPIVQLIPDLQNRIILYIILPIINGLLCFAGVWVWRKFLRKFPVEHVELLTPPYAIEQLAFIAGFLCIFVIFEIFAYILGTLIAVLTILKIQQFLRQMISFLPPHHYITRREIFVFLGFFIDLIIFFTLLNLTFRIIGNPVITAYEDLIIGAPIPAMKTDNLFNALYFTIITLTTVGYGDFIPLTYFGKMIVALECLTSYVMFGLMIGLVARGIRLNKTRLTPIRQYRRYKLLTKPQIKRKKTKLK